MEQLRNYSMRMWGLDGLHICDYHGVTGHVAGNLLAEIFKGAELGDRTQAETIDHLNWRLHGFYESHGISERIPDISTKLVGLDVTDGWPFLGGIGVKATNTRKLVPWLLELARVTNDGSRYKTRRLMVVEALHKYYTVIYEAGMFLTEQQKKDVKTAVDTCLVNYTYLSWRCMRGGIRIFKNLKGKR